MIRKPIITRFHLLLLGLLAAITAAAFFKVSPDVGLPVHWGFDGRPDRVWPRTEALLLFPVLGVFLIVLFGAIGQFAPPEQIEPGRHISEAVLTGLLLLCCGLQFSLILIGVGSDIDMVRVIAFGLALLLVLLGLALPNSQPNPYAGMRLPWTVRDPRAWKAVHRVTGVLFVLAGIGLAAVAWVRPDPADMFPAIGVAVFAPLLLGGVYSVLRARG